MHNTPRAAPTSAAADPQGFEPTRTSPAHPHFLAEDARDSLRLARHAAERGDASRSLQWYRRAVCSWRRANERAGGRWQTELDAARRECRTALRRLARLPA